MREEAIKIDEDDKRHCLFIRSSFLIVASSLIFFSVSFFLLCVHVREITKAKKKIIITSH